MRLTFRLVRGGIRILKGNFQVFSTAFSVSCCLSARNSKGERECSHAPFGHVASRLFGWAVGPKCSVNAARHMVPQEIADGANVDPHVIHHVAKEKDTTSGNITFIKKKDENFQMPPICCN